ncbi:hypothetical protein [Cupriavidus sp. TMH.W2]|uniref:hypothetical protein n=1 Tax=Cupriavidus sp. TMH.W2 TaxID=3434465 RepID=UPI003D7822D3
MPTKPLPIFADEYHSYATEPDFALKSELREMEGVPNARYLVEDNRVFVFERLVELVKAAGPTLPPDGSARVEAVRAMLPQAWTTPQDAVGRYDVVPKAWVVRETADGFEIHHHGFPARIARRFVGRAELHDALARLLAGVPVPLPGTADFYYRDQGYTLLGACDVASLPAAPASMAVTPEPVGSRSASGKADLPSMESSSLGAFAEGFAPVTQARFDALHAVEARWHRHGAAIRCRLDADHDWAALLAGLPVPALNADSAPPLDPDTVATLRRTYPELAALNDATLEGFSEDVTGQFLVWGCTAQGRDCNLIMYVLGRLAEAERDSAVHAGMVVAHQLLGGHDFATAAHAARQSVAYDHALRAMVGRVARALRFVADDTDALRDRGPEVRFFVDWVAGLRGRSTVMQVTQKLADLRDAQAFFDTGARA